HAVQIVDALPWDEIDLPLSVIVTPEETFAVKNPPPAPAGIAWDRLTDEDLNEMPVLAELRKLRAADSAQHRLTSKRGCSS
ncbi:MAG: hypothetical protein AABY90_10610, partial [Nitrospirota bacterium]